MWLRFWNKFNVIKIYLRGLFDKDGLSTFPTSKVVLFCHDFTRNYQYNNLKYSSLIDSVNQFLAECNIETITIARPYSSIPPEDCFGKVFCVNGGFARSRLADMLTNKLIKKINLFNIRENFFQCLFWEKVLKKIQPKIIIGIEPLKEMCIAAKAQGILVFDIQHGVISANPTAHFYRMSLREPYQMGWPDYIVTRDTVTDQWLKKNRINHVKSIQLGHPWLSRFNKINWIKDQLIIDTIKRFPLNDSKPTILYSLQHLRDKNGNIHSFSPIPEIVEEYIKSEKGQKYQWWIRIHPVLLSEPNFSIVTSILKQKFRGFDNVEWEHPTLAPLPYLLRFVGLHLTRDSSVTTEAALFGIRTGFLEEESNLGIILTAFNNEIDIGMAQILDTNSIKHFSNFINLAFKEPLKAYADEKLVEQFNNFQNFAQMINIYIKRDSGSSFFDF